MNLFKKSNLHTLNDLVDKAKKVDDVIRRHCKLHQCCEEDDKSQVTDDILAEITGLNKYLGERYNQFQYLILKIHAADIAMDSIAIRNTLDEISLYIKKENKGQL